jgi:hypothetical protein
VAVAGVIDTLYFGAP